MAIGLGQRELAPEKPDLPRAALELLLALPPQLAPGSLESHSLLPFLGQLPQYALHVGALHVGIRGWRQRPRLEPRRTCTRHAHYSSCACKLLF